MVPVGIKWIRSKNASDVLIAMAGSEKAVCSHVLFLNGTFMF